MWDIKKVEISNISYIFSIQVELSIKSTKSNNKATLAFPGMAQIDQHQGVVICGLYGGVVGRTE